MIPCHKKNVIHRAAVPGFAISRVGIQRRLIVKPVAILIGEVPIVAVVQADGVHPQFGKGVQFIRLRDAVVVLVNP
jgi:hypothetical protein